ncbi:DUF4365 domain-containing protein [Fodinicola acaciae]|uniref:DUF4365 domain-containing protein n=1 Tax=Fodinicola acaciae TaxID=2681555 RepID=UPI0024839737|nr:DUF4365 domain-containing protein [Fodinicola acaciae]
MPGGISTGRTDREGIALFDLRVSRDLKWIFREQQVRDQGIDGQVEVADEDRGTGRLIAVQIKSGPSYFVEVRDGWAFYYSSRERQLWLGHALPVMVVMVDLENDAIYWQRISAETERKTPKGYAVTLPPNQILATAADAWRLAASGVEQRATERFDVNLEVLPPPVRRVIETDGGNGSQATLLALHLAEGRGNPIGTAQALITSRPFWMETPTSWSWRALASYCAHHGAMRESADALEIAAESCSDRNGIWLAAAALNVVGEDRARARTLLESARSHGGGDVLVAIVEAILERPEGDASPLRTDTVLAAAGTEIGTDAAAQSFLAEQAIRAQDLGKAARHCERALELDPTDTDCMARIARIYGRRSITSGAQADDLRRAADLLSAAVTQRRQWSGPTHELLAQLARTLMLRGEHRLALRWLLPPPHGTATPEEATDPILLRNTLVAAHMSGASDVVSAIQAQMTEDLQDRVTQVQLGLLALTEPDTMALWQADLTRAEAENDWEGIAQAVHRLATLGVDVIDHLYPMITAGILPPGADRLPRALVVLHDHPEDGLALLRTLAAEDVSAAEYLVQTLIDMDRLDDAAEACRASFERFRSPRFLTQRALLLFSSNPDNHADDALREALQVEDRPAERVMLATRRAHIAGNSGQWSIAESILSAALAEHDHPPDSVVWGLIEVQLAAAAEDRAAATISRHQPQIRSASDARLWAHAMANVPWDDAIASEAIALASRFSDHAALATSLLTLLLSVTRGATEKGNASDSEDVDSNSDQLDERAEGHSNDNRPVVSGELHRRAFEALGALVEEHGTATGVQVIESTSADDLLRTIEEITRRSASPDLSDLVDSIARGRLPAGIVATVFRKTYTSALVRRAAGQLVAVAADESEHEAEMNVAMSAREGPVAVDLSTLMILSRLTDSEILTGQVTAMHLPRAGRDDVRRAAIEVQSLGSSPGRLAWDARAQRPVFYEQSSEEYRLVRERTEAMEAAIRRTTTRDVHPSSVLEEMPAMIQGEPWLASIELAKQEDVPLWCDDLAVRRLARAVGVQTFSTMAMADGLRDIRIELAQTPEEDDEVIQFISRVTEELVAEYVTDVPITLDQLIKQARVDDWAPAAAALTLSRPSWWIWQTEPVTALLRLYAAIKESDPSQLTKWQYAAMLGAARSRSTPEESRQVLANLALLGCVGDLDNDPEFDDLVAGCRNARSVTNVLDQVGDPVLGLPAARLSLAAAGVVRSEETMQALIAALGAPSAEP